MVEKAVDHMFVGKKLMYSFYSYDSFFFFFLMIM